MNPNFSASVLEAMFALTWQTSLRASVLIGFVLMLLVVSRKLNPGWRIFLAAIIFVRLVVPFAPESRFSIFNLWEVRSISEVAAPAEAKDEWAAKQQGAFGESTLLVRGAVSKQQGTFDEATLLDRKFPRAEISWAGVASVVWLSGVVVILGVAAIRQFWLNRSLRSADELWSNEQMLCFQQLGMPRRKVLPICNSEAIRGPAIAGMFWPRLILPRNFGTAFSEPERHAILLHELAHLKRGDVFWSGLTFFVAALHWMNPLVWVVRRGLCRDLELACDGTVLRKMTSEERPNYGRALLQVAELVANPRERMTVLAAPFFNESSNLKNRIQMIVNPKKTSKWGILVMSGLVMMLCLGTFTSATADDEKADDEKSERVTSTSESRRLLATAERLEKLGLRKEAAEYRAKAGGGAVANLRDGERDGGGDRGEMKRDGDRNSAETRRDGWEGDGARDREREGEGERGDLAERLRRLEAENKKLRAELARLRKVRD